MNDAVDRLRMSERMRVRVCVRVCACVCVCACVAPVDEHAKGDAGTLRRDVPFQAMVNCDGTYCDMHHPF
jgi:hypothetical protein